MWTRRTGFIFFSLLLFLAACSDADGPSPAPPPSPDQQAISANNRAVGLMGRFEYQEALEIFSRLSTQWRDWNDVRINLAIATLNRQLEGDELKALELSQGVLREEPENLRARYLSGLIQLFLGLAQEARGEFEQVVDADPGDAHAAYYLAQCHAQLAQPEQALTWYRKALTLDPYLRSAYYGAFQTLQRLGHPQEAAELVAEYQRLENNPRSRLAEFKYTRMGPKAEAIAIDVSSEPPAAIPRGGLFAEQTSLQIENAASLNWRSTMTNYRPSLTTVDLQGDDLVEIFLTGALEIGRGDEGPIYGNLLLTGEEHGGYTALTEHPLAAVSDVNAALWGDFDNDGLVDVYLCRRGSNQLWRQVARGSWQDISAQALAAGAELNTVDGAFFDADHDGDLDLFLVNSDGPNELMNNNLDGTFRPLAADYQLTGSTENSFMVLPADLDNDRDADLVVLNHQPPHDVYINDRLWSYHRAEGYEQFENSPAVAVLSVDSDSDGLKELYSISPGGEVLRWRSGSDGQLQAETLVSAGIAAGGSANQLAAFDVSGDGRLELVVSSPSGWEAFSSANGSTESLFSAQAAPDTLYSASTAFIGRSDIGPGMLAFPPADQALAYWPPGEGRYPFVTLTLSGRQDGAQSMRSNASGLGAQLAFRTGSRWTLLENYRHQTGPGQSLQPLAVGLNGALQADFISIDWSDGVFQSEIDIETGRLHRITETQRQLSSCPVLFAWNGSEYAFVSDFLGVGGMGYAIGPGEYATPRPHENFLLPEGLLQSRNSHYELKIAEPMEENAYIDAARLAVYDLPPGWSLVLDERMGISGPPPTGEARFYRQERIPARAFNDRGEDVIDRIRSNDGVAAPVGDLDRRFIGRLNDEHVLTFEFDRPLDDTPGEAILVIDGWVEYPYSQTNFAAWQAGAEYRAPTLEALVDGRWQVVLDQFGYPAGMPRRMSVPLPELPRETASLRLRTNMQVYWDRIAVAFAEDPPEHVKQVMDMTSAVLGKKGFARRSTLEQFRPHYDYSKLSPFWDTRYMAGFYTRLGPVDELLSTQDDAVAIIGPGEELHLEFTEAGGPSPGWRRYFVLETNGWAKDMDLFTRDGETVGPLPASGKPADARDHLHERYNTRYQSGH